jgi:hypothetical protein
MNETDRELLMFAAKAAGIGPLSWIEPDGTKIVTNLLWNPLADDGDAFRLKVKLEIDIMYTNIFSPRVHAMADYDIEVTEESKDDPYAAARRAIVRAAAEIGRNMK